METRPGDCRPLKLHRIEDRDRIDESGPGGRPLHLPEHGLRLLIPPLKGKRIPRKLRRPAERFSIGDVIQEKNQAVGGEVIVLHPLRKILHGSRDLSSPNQPVLHDGEALLPEEFKLPPPAVLKIHGAPVLLFCGDQRKGEQLHMPLLRNPGVQLADRARAEIPRVLIAGLRVQDAVIDPLKIRVADERLPAEHEAPRKRDAGRHIVKNSDILRDELPDLSVPPGDSPYQLSSLVVQNDGKPVQLPGEKPLPVPEPFRECLRGLCLIEREHGG